MTIVHPWQIVVAARRWVGTPFRHQGRDANGIDCVGLPIVIARSFNLLPPTFVDPVYGRAPTGEIVDQLCNVCTRTTRAVPGSLIVIAWTKLAAHVAICTGDTMVHAYESVGSVVEHGYRGRWVRMTHSVWLIPGVTYE